MNISNLIRNNRLKIIVKPNSRENKIALWDNSRQALKVEISAPADKNKANVEVIKFFSKLTRKKTRIISGPASKEKILKFE